MVNFATSQGTDIPDRRPAERVIAPSPMTAVHNVSTQVTFEAQEVRDYIDSLVVISNTEKVEVPLRAIAPVSDIQVVGSLDLGICVNEDTIKKNIYLKNTGGREANFELIYERSPLFTLDPEKGTVQAGSSVAIQAIHSPIDLGVFGQPIEIKFDDGKPSRRIEASATSVNHTFDLLRLDQKAGNGAPVSKITFGSVYYGDQKQIFIELLNNGPTAAQFQCRLQAREDAEIVAARQDDDPDEEDSFEAREARNVSGLQVLSRLKGWKAKVIDTTLTIRPDMGKIAPFERIKLELQFSPKKEWPATGFQHAPLDPTSLAFDLCYLCTFVFRNNPKRLKIPILGKATMAALRLVPPRLLFGEVDANRHVDAMVLLENINEDLPFNFTISRSTFFKAEPDQGYILPGQALSVMVTFSPRALGKVKDSLTLKVLSIPNGTLLQEMALPVKGNSSSEAPRVKITGGANALPEDYHRERTFVSEDVDDLRPPKPKFKREATLEKSEVIDRFETELVPGDHVLTYEEAQQKQQHKAKYEKYLKDERATRDRKAEVALMEKKGLPPVQFETDATQMGMQSASGLKSPRLKLPTKVDKLYMVSKDDLVGAYVRPRNRPAYLQEEAALGLHKYKTKPVTAEEVKECNLTLSPYEITRLACGPTQLDFGQVCALSSTTKYFAVTNDLKQNIMVKVHLRDSEELIVEPDTQVVPPGGTAGMGLTLCVTTVQEYKQTVSYTINNGAHLFSFDVSADVVPVTLQLNRDAIVFSFTPDNWEPFVVETVMITNPNSYPAEFSWESPNPSFTVNPMIGMVDAKSSLPAVIKWKPSTVGATNEANLNFKVVGATATKIVQCRGENPEGKCAFREKSLDLHTVSVGVLHQHHLQLRNTGSSDAVFQVEIPKNPKINIHFKPLRGCISAGFVQELEVTVEASEPGTYDIPVLVTVRGGKTLKMPIKCEAIIPTVTVDQDEFNFGEVYIGGSSLQSVTLTNASSIMAELELDLKEYGAFNVELTRDMWSNEDYEESPIQRVGRNMTPLRTPDMRSSKSLKDKEPVDGKEPEGEMYKVKVAPNKSLMFNMVFRPCVIASHAFELPLVLSGIVSNTLRKVVVAEALRPRLLLSNTILEFGSKIVLRERVKKIPYALDISLTNNDRSALTWELGTPKANPEASKKMFEIEPRAGSLEMGGTVTMRITFLPRDANAYEVIYPLFLEGKTDKPYVCLEVRGAGTFPRLLFNMREVELPPVPLGVTSVARFMVVNQGYDNLELQYKLPADTSRVPLHLEFPEGKMIGIAKERVPVELSFVSNKPMSFTANIEFIDEDGNRFSVPVTGTTDSCLLTTNSFVESNFETIEFECEETTPVRLKMEGQDFVMPPTDWDMEEKTSNLLRWLNATNMRTMIENIPEDFVSSRGQRLIELIEFVSGKPVPGRNVKLSANKKEQAEQMVQMFERILTHLKSFGALLNPIKPEFLLDVEDFRRILSGMEAKLELMPQPCALGDALVHWQAVEEHWPVVSAGAWHNILYQVLKVFVLSRVTIRQFRSVPGIDPSVLQGDTTLAGSNIYSVSENLLLKWMTLHFQRALPSYAMRITNFDVDLQNGLAFYSLFVSHWPSMESFYTSMHKPCKIESHYSDNAKVVLEMLAALNLPFEISRENLVQPHAREMLIFVLYLYQTLPQFIPKTTIEFSGLLGQTLVKTIELTNPSKKSISYAARLEGSTAFSLTTKMVKLEPMSTVEFPVECVPATSKPVHGRLIFSSRREGGAHAATMVFALQCITQSRKAIRSCKMECKLYELQTMSIEVLNPFPGDCEFAVSIEQRQLPPEPEPEPEEKKAAQGSNRSGKKKEKAPPPPEEEMTISAPYPGAFGVDRRTLRMKQGERGMLTASFLPFQMGRHHMDIIFNTDMYGEFVYDILGETLLPAPVGPPIKFVVEDPEGPVTRDVVMPYLNVQLEQAKRTFLEKHPLSKVKDQAELVRGPREYAKEVRYKLESTNSLLQAPTHITLRNVPQKPRKENGPTPATPTNNRPTTNQTQAAENSDLQSPAASAKPDIDTLSAGDPSQAAPDLPAMDGEEAPVDEAAEAPGAMAAAEGAPEEPIPNALYLTLVPKGPGLYPGRMMMYSTQDVRVVEVEFQTTESQTTAVLEFECPARQSITQDIPLVNSSDKILSIKSLITGDCFTGPREVLVPPMETEQYTLSFKPTWIGEYNGELQLLATSTGEVNTYSLKGMCEEPLAEGHVIIHCNARTTVTHTFVLSNLFGKDRDCHYTVYSDMMPHVSGKDHVKVQAGLSATFHLSVHPTKSGITHGSISFTGPNGQYLWYTLEVHTKRPPPEDTIELACEVRTAMVAKIPVSNPLDYELEFEVQIVGRDFLGKRKLIVAANEGAEFELVFSPLFPGDVVGAVQFTNEKLGEFWYKLQGKASPAAEVVLPQLKSPVGARVSHMLQVTNPLEREIVLTSSSNNMRNFTVSPSSIVLPPFESADISVEYIPSSIQHVEEALVTLESEDAGVWVYKCSGFGEKPEIMDAAIVTANIGQSTSSMVNFINPFPTTLTVSLCLETKESPSVFSLLMKRTKGVSLSAFSTMQIPLSFSPNRMATCVANILVSTEVDGLDLMWNFPVHGISEAAAAAHSFKFKTKARTRIEETMTLTLAGLGPNTEDEAFTHEVIVNAVDRQALKRSLQITALDTVIANCDAPLRFAVVFEPQRILSTTVDFVISKASGGRWRFEIQLEGTEADIDGTLKLEAFTNETASQKITLSNPEHGPDVPFTCVLSADTPDEFYLRPQRGVFKGEEPVEIEVFFSPQDYGKNNLAGRLLVQTEVTQWVYELRGTRPAYNPPVGKSKVENKHTGEVVKRIKEVSPERSRQKNYLKQNLKAPKQQEMALKAMGLEFTGRE
ncbi:hypothetical protein CYMTET_35412 [Cymbomonas tetramitiformis]|uniref:Calponin-homology (CH) domain-containing protein n=1 Tax=Cymbomonas tetramitiformis TaxID=36881 RepID=A0AAE0F966_9CHLO|nr:hypothetical protein CYMTET_35412 [Cymbomonas tetramitiformis]